MLYSIENTRESIKIHFSEIFTFIKLFCIGLIFLRISITAFSGFEGIYDVEHFIKSLRYDVRIVEKLPEITKNGKTKKIKGYQVRFF